MGSSGQEIISMETVQEFVTYCQNGLSAMRDGSADNSEEARMERLNSMLCRFEDQNQTPHSKDQPPVDNASKFARFSNKLRELEDEGKLDSEYRTAIEEGVQGWGWSDACICRCSGCERFLSNKGYKYLYSEKLVRAVPWYADDAKVQDGQQVFARKDLLQCITMHWEFFAYIQESIMAKMPRMEADKVEVAALSVEAPSALCESWPSGIDGLNRQAYAAAALLNDIRRDLESGRTKNPPDALNGLDPPFRSSVALNFEGTEDDNYCLGSRPSACKWYVGVSNDERRRHQQHAGKDDGNSKSGAYYIRFLCGRAARGKPDPFGGWKLTSWLDKDEQEEAYIVRRANFSCAEEDARMVSLCCSHGLHHVRGGINVLPRLSGDAKTQLELQYRARFGLCSKCGEKGHMVSKCPSAGQAATEDPAVRDFEALDTPGDADDRNGDPFERAAFIAQAIFGQRKLVVRRMFTMTNRAEQIHNDDDSSDAVVFASTTNDRAADAIGQSDDSKIWSLVEDLYGPGTGLRTLQLQALRHAFEGRRDIMVTLPTAYGKTRVYTVAAVQEVLDGGRAVVFLPYSSLMADVARAFADISSRSQYGVVEPSDENTVWYESDKRIKGTSSPYGGRFHVGNGNKGELKAVTWTIWRGVTGDEHMREHVKTEVFKCADIVICTPDKWAYTSGGPANCDCFLSTFGGDDEETRRAWVKSLGLVVIDEAHEFWDVFGGNIRVL